MPGTFKLRGLCLLVFVLSTVFIFQLMVRKLVFNSHSRRRSDSGGELTDSSALQNKKAQRKISLRKDQEKESPHALLPDCFTLLEPGLGHKNVTIYFNTVTYLGLKKKFASQLQHGGHYCPADCKPRDHTAIIIPYRNRGEQLMKLLNNLIPFLIRQKICFTTFVIEQTSQFPFNRCLLFNVGFVESQKLGHFTCFFLHDTDLIPRRYGNLYRCHDKRPRHFVITRSNKPFQGLPYPTYIGGVLAVRRQQMVKINGCSNMFYNWGFEDDDLYQRRPLLSTVKQRMSTDGLNSLQYTMEDFHEKELYTWMLVGVPPPPASIYSPQARQQARPQESPRRNV